MKSVKDKIYSRFENEVDIQAIKSVVKPVRKQVYDQVSNQVWNQIGELVVNQVWDQVRDQFLDRTAFQMRQIDHDPKIKLDEFLFRHMILNILRFPSKQFKSKYGVMR